MTIEHPLYEYWIIWKHQENAFIVEVDTEYPKFLVMDKGYDILMQYKLTDTNYAFIKWELVFVSNLPIPPIEE